MHIFTQSGWLILFSPDHFSGQHQIGESPPNTLFLRSFQTGQTYLLSTLLLAAASHHHGESHLIYGPLASILLDQRFPVEYELDEFNLPHTGTTLSCLQLWLCQLRRKIPLRQPATSKHFLETFTLLSPNDQNHTFMDDDYIPVLNQQTRLLIHYGDRISLTHSTML